MLLLLSFKSSRNIQGLALVRAVLFLFVFIANHVNLRFIENINKTVVILKKYLTGLLFELCVDYHADVKI